MLRVFGHFHLGSRVSRLSYSAGSSEFDLQYTPALNRAVNVLVPSEKTFTKSLAIKELNSPRLGKGILPSRGDGKESLNELIPFKNLGVSNELEWILKSLNFTSPTRVQVASMPAVANGENVLISAATGTGKTLAYLAPLVSNVLTAYKNGVLKKEKRVVGRAGHPSTLILTPSRELAAQVGRIMDKFHEKLQSGRFKQEEGKRSRTKIDYAIVTGGEKVAPQKKALRNGADVVIATPERLLEHIQAGYVDLVKLKSMVLDEADLLLGPESIMSDQVLEIINSVRKRGRDVQFILSSATSSVQSIEAYRKVIPELEVIAHQGVLPPQLKQAFVTVLKDDPADILLKILSDFELEEALKNPSISEKNQSNIPKIEGEKSIHANKKLVSFKDASSSKINFKEEMPLTENKFGFILDKLSFEEESSNEMENLIQKIDIPDIKDNEVLTFDWDSDNEEIDENGNYKASVYVEDLNEKVNRNFKHEALALTPTLAKMNVSLTSPAENAHIVEMLSTPSNSSLDNQNVLSRTPTSVTFPTIIFTNSIKSCRFVHHVLKEASVDAVFLHGLVEPDERKKVLQQFACGQAFVLVTTGVISRGIDLPLARHVINFDFPTNVTSYIHQAGRTARASRPGTVTTIVTRKDLNKAQSLRMGECSSSPLISAAGRTEAADIGKSYWENFGDSCQVLGIDEYSQDLLQSSNRIKSLKSHRNNILKNNKAELTARVTKHYSKRFAKVIKTHQEIEDKKLSLQKNKNLFL